MCPFQWPYANLHVIRINVLHSGKISAFGLLKKNFLFLFSENLFKRYGVFLKKVLHKREEKNARKNEDDLAER